MQEPGLIVLEFSNDLLAPVIAEVLAVQRTMAIAEATGSPMYVLHMTSGRALKVVEDAKRRGLTVFAESRPWNLFGTEMGYTKPDGGIYAPKSRLRNYETCLGVMCFAAANRDSRARG